MEVATPMTQAGLTDMVFSTSLHFLSIMHQICLAVSLLKPKTLKVKESELPMEN
jgi:hypothetical protein